MADSVLIAIIAGGAALAVVLLGGVGVVLWRRSVKRELVRLLAASEAVHSALKSVENVVSRLAAASDGDLVAFALDGETEDRRVLGEVASQTGIIAQELAGRGLPSALAECADALEHAAAALGEQAEMTLEVDGVEVLDALATIQLNEVREHLAHADGVLRALSDRYHLESAAVYGGGLYI